MKIAAFLCSASLLLSACSQESSGGSSADANLLALRTKLRQLVESGDRSGAAQTAGELMEKGESDPEMLFRIAKIFETTRHPEPLIACLERLFEQHATKLDDANLALLWMGFGRTCGLTGQIGPFLATWASVRGGSPSIVQASDRGLVVLLESARSAGRGRETRAKMEEAIRRAPEMEPVWRSYLPLLSADRAAAMAARKSAGIDAEMEAAILAASEGRFDDARAILSDLAEKLPGESAQRRSFDALLLALDIGTGAPLEPWLARALPLVESVELRGKLGRVEEALALLADESRAREMEPAQRRHLHLKVLREAGRGDEALALIDPASGGPLGEAGNLPIVRARVLLELGRIEEALVLLESLEAAPPPAVSPIALHQTLALARILAGRGAEARASIDATRRVFPVNPGEVEESWGPAQYLAAAEEDLDAIAFSWTRFPRFKDNDRLFHDALRALLAGDRAKAHLALEACVAKSVSGEYPCRLAQSALRSPALQR